MPDEVFQELERQFAAPEVARVERAQHRLIFGRQLVFDGVEFVEIHAAPARPARAAHEFLERGFGGHTVRHVHVPSDATRNDLLAAFDALREPLQRAERAPPFGLGLEQLAQQ